MSKQKTIGWTCSETIGIGIINTRALYRPLHRLYSEILKQKIQARVVDIKEDGTYVIETYEKRDNSYWSLYMLEPIKETN